LVICQSCGSLVADADRCATCGAPMQIGSRPDARPVAFAGSTSNTSNSAHGDVSAQPVLNKTYLGHVRRVTDFGAFVEIMPGIEGLLHVSEIADHRVWNVRKELAEGQQVFVKIINIDRSGKKIRLSRRGLQGNT
jgi:polyribonucleotide nucleotidyltransferase